MAVWDYELNRFAVIKNTVYQNYLEHVRHMFLESLGVKFTDFLHWDLVRSLQELHWIIVAH